MLRKDIILWFRSWRRMAFEIVFPVFVFIVIAIIRISIPIKSNESHQNLSRYMVPLSPLPTPDSAGVPWWKDEEEVVPGEALKLKDNNMILSNLYTFKKQEDFLKFHGFNQWELKAANPWGKWLADNCEETMLNKARRKFGIIGDVVNSQMTRELMRDIRDYHDLKSRFKMSTSHFWDIWGK